jgi:hypothetical protein
VPIKLKLKNSVIRDKAPQPADLDVGELALNCNDQSPAAYIKDSAGVVRKIAGVGSVSTPVASDTVQGIVELATDAEATAGADATRAVTPANLKAALAAQAGSATAPSAPTVGQVWIDSSTTPSTINVWNGTAWIPQTGATITSPTAPATPATGQIWIDTSVIPNVTQIWDGTAWVPATPDGSAAAAIANDAKYATKAELQAEDLWDRTGTTLTTKTAGDKVAAAALPAATTAVAGAVQLADAAAVTAGTAGRVVDAAQLKAAVAAEDLWDRTGTEITTKTAGDKVFVGGDVKVGGTTGAPNITLSAGGAGTFNDRLTVRKLVNPDYTANIWKQGGGNPSLAGYTLYLSSGEPGSPSSATRLGFGASGIVDNAAITLMGDYVTPFFGFTHGISIGGTLPSAPNITLGADGNAGFGVIPATLAGFGRTVRVKGAGASGVIAEGVNGDTWLEMYSGLTAADGTAVIYPSTGTLRFATTTSVGTTGFSEKARLTSTGDFLLGGTLPSAPNLTLSAGGIATAKVVRSLAYAATLNKGATVTLFGAGLPSLQAGRLTVTAHAIGDGGVYAIRTYLIYNNSPNWIIKELTADSMAGVWAANDTAFIVGGSGTSALTLQAVIDNMDVRASFVY